MMNGKRFLIVVDMQKDFIDGALGTAEAQAIVDNAVAEIRAKKAEGWVVIATMDTHEPFYLQTQEGRNLPVVHCVRGTEGWQLDPRVAEALGDAQRVEKPTFGSALLPTVIASQADGMPAAIELIGLCTDICVVSNALMLKAIYPETPMCVNAACCAGVTPAKHEAALETMRSCQIATL